MGESRNLCSIISKIIFIGSFLFYCNIPKVYAEYYPGDNFFSEYSYAPHFFGRSGSSSSSRSMVSIDLNPKVTIDNALRVAAREDRLLDLQSLIEKGADVNSKTTTGMSPLMFAARNCSPKMAELLLKNKVDVNATDLNGRTSLIFAARESCWKVVELLVKVPGVQFLAKDKSRRTALDYASEDALLEVGGPAQKIMGLILFSRK